MEALIELVENYGLWTIFVIALLQSVGIPLPAFAILIVTAAITPNNPSNIAFLIFAASVGSLLGDLILYSAGRSLGTKVLSKLCKISISPDSCVQSSGDLFNRFGPSALTVVKFIPGLSTLAPVVAGVYAMPRFTFTLLSTLAAALYTGVAVALGVIFRDGIESLIAKLTEYGKFGILIVFALFLIYLLGKWWQRYRLIKQFNIDRITVSDLSRLINEQEEAVILDARPADQRIKHGFIPGSVPVSESNLKEIANRYAESDHVVVYCSCPNEISAAKYAQKLRKTGLKRIRPLLGGIDEWARSGGKVIIN